MKERISRVCQGIAPSATLQLNAQVNEMRAQGMDVIGLGAGEPDFATPAFICQAAKKALDQGETRYTAAAGTPRLRQAIGTDLQKRKGLAYAADQVIVSTGAKQALMNALAALLNPGDEVLLPAPCWISYPEMIAMAGGRAVMIPATEAEGFIPAFRKICAAVTARTRAIIINSPSNPTGAVWSREQLLAVGRLAVEKDFFIISDEIYDQLVYDGAQALSIASLAPEIYDRTIVINGWSKTYAMTGWRLGYAAAPRDLAAAMGAYQSHFTGNANAMAQAAGLAALEGDQGCVREMAAAFAHRRDLMADLIGELPYVSCFVPRGAFYILMNVQSLLGRSFQGEIIGDSGDLCRMLLRHALIAPVPGDPFGAPGYVRISFAISEGRIMEAMHRLGAFLAQVK